MRLLHGLGDHVAAGHLERAALEARIRRHHHHVGDLLGGLERHGALFLGRDVEAAELEPGRALADAELRPPVGDEVEHGDGLGRARGVVVVGDHLADAVAEPDALGAGGRGGQEHVGGRAVRVFLEEVVLDRPRVVEPQPVGQLDLGQRVLHQLVLVVGTPGLGQLQLVEDAEFHRLASHSPFAWRWCPARKLGSSPELGCPPNASEWRPLIETLDAGACVFRHEADLEAVAGRLGKALERACRRAAAACFETGDDGLGGAHALGQFRLGEARIRSGLDERGNQRELLFESVVGFGVARALAGFGKHLGCRDDAFLEMALVIRPPRRVRAPA